MGLAELLGLGNLTSYGRAGGGCINEGSGYVTPEGLKIFVKKNTRSEAYEMFEGEFASLKALHDTSTVRVPKPIKAIKNPDGGGYLVTEYIDIQSLRKHSAELGKRLAQLHIHNQQLIENSAKLSQTITKQSETVKPVKQFGFAVPTCCGYIPQDNSWNDDWISFFARQRLDLQIQRLLTSGGNRELNELWSELQLKLDKFFTDAGEITPALLHGDLWGGNAGETDEEPVIFDPASFYGHHEYEFGILNLFGGYNNSFHHAYHEIIPKQPGFDRRVDLYQLFHLLNHWNHFGGGYQSQSLSLMRRLIKDK